MSTQVALTSTLKKYRQELNLTQSDVSDLVSAVGLESVSQNLISKIEKGVGDTTTEKLKAICYALKVSPEDLLFPEDEDVYFLYRHTSEHEEENRSMLHPAQGTHETIKMLSDLNYKLASDGGKLDTDELMAVEALLRTCLKSLHKEVKNDTTTESAKTA